MSRLLLILTTVVAPTSTTVAGHSGSSTSGGAANHVGWFVLAGVVAVTAATGVLRRRWRERRRPR